MGNKKQKFRNMKLKKKKKKRNRIEIYLGKKSFSGKLNFQ